MGSDRTTIDADRFTDEAQLHAWCDRIGGEGYRGTATAAQERTIAWVESELRSIPGVTVRTDEYEVVRWQPTPEGDLEAAGSLRVKGVEVAVAGAVPYTRPVERQGSLVYVPPGAAVTDAVAGQVVLRDFPDLRLPYDLLLGLGFHLTPDADELRGATWDRPGLADTILHHDLLAAGAAGAAGVVIAFDLPREQVAGYYEPHKGTHYDLPAVFVGVEERDRLRALALAPGGATATLAVKAEVGPATTRNVIATLPGRSPERIVLVSHTDGNTWVQENGIAALLALARYFAEHPLERTLELAFTSAHLHISREGALRYAGQLDEQYDDGTIAFAFAIEHLGARALEPVERTDGGPGRRLAFADGADPVLWAAGPSEPIRTAVVDAVARRGLERVIVAPGFSGPVEGQVPRIVSFGGLGTYFNQHLIPTTSIITGPWSLWAPSFGADAIDIGRVRQQALAAGDVIATLDGVPREALAGDYLADRAARAAGTPVGLDDVPPEHA